MLSLTQLSVALPRLVYKITSCNNQFQECIFVNSTKLQAADISSSILAICCPVMFISMIKASKLYNCESHQQQNSKSTKLS